MSNETPEEAFRRFMAQMQRRASTGGGGGGLPGRGLFAGGGLVLALAAGAFALNSSLFTG